MLLPWRGQRLGRTFKQVAASFHVLKVYCMLNFSCRKNAGLEQLHARPGSAVLQLQEEHSKALRERGETAAAFERYLSFVRSWDRLLSKMTGQCAVYSCALVLNSVYERWGSIREESFVMAGLMALRN